MILTDPGETLYDLRWRMFGIPVRVHPMFWLVSVIMGWNLAHMGIHFLLIWIACVFVSILIHELGHVLMGRWFGADGHIVLYGFGGLAIGSNQLDERWQRIAVCFAGPLAGFVFLGALFLGLYAYDADVFPLYLEMAAADVGLWSLLEGPFDIPRERIPDQTVVFTIQQLIFINLLWGLVNLLPIWPLDGGQISRDLCEGVSPARGSEHAFGISLVLAAFLSLHCIASLLGRPILPVPFGSFYTAILFAFLAFQSFQMLQQLRAQRDWEDDYREY